MFGTPFLPYLCHSIDDTSDTIVQLRTLSLASSTSDPDAFRCLVHLGTETTLSIVFEEIAQLLRFAIVIWRASFPGEVQGHRGPCPIQADQDYVTGRKERPWSALD